MRFEIWRFAVAPSDAAEKNCNIGAQLQLLPCIKSPKCFGKFTSCMTFGAQKLVHSEPFRITYTNFDAVCTRCTVIMTAICGKKLYRCTSTFSALNCCGGIFFKSFIIIIIIIITRTIFIVLSSWPGHCESSLGSSGECRAAPSGRRPSDQGTWLGLRVRLF